MTSSAFRELEVALADVDALLRQARSFGGGNRGAPKNSNGQARPGRPFTRSATVTLAGALEAFFESLALETAGLLPLNQTQVKDVKAAVSGMHGIGTDKVHGLYAMLGVPFILDTLSWQRMPKGTVRAKVAALHTARNKIGHGRAPQTAQVATVESQRALVENVAKAMVRVMSARVKDVTGVAPAW